MITIRTVDEVPWIVLDRPERRNALDESGWLGIREALATISDREDGLVVITGTRPVFCAGDDITEAARLDPVQLREYAIEVVFATIRAIVEHPGPVIAAVNGDAIGGGAEIVAVCDLAIAVDEARFSLPEARLGAAPVQFAVTAQATMPLKWAKAMALGGRRVSASEALRNGLLTDVVAAEQLIGAVGDWVADIRRAPAEAVRRTKRILNQELREVGLPRMEHALRDMLGDAAD